MVTMKPNEIYRNPQPNNEGDPMPLNYPGGECFDAAIRYIQYKISVLNKKIENIQVDIDILEEALEAIRKAD